MNLCDTTTEGERLAVLATLKACYALRLRVKKAYDGWTEGVDLYADLIKEAINELKTNPGSGPRVDQYDAIVKAAKLEALKDVLALRNKACKLCEYDESPVDGIDHYVKLIEAEIAKL